MRDRLETVPARPHKPDDVGSIPTPATNKGVYMNAKECIERLAEINCADDLIGVTGALSEERKLIVDFLRKENIIELGENGGFRFIGDNVEYMKWYLYCYETF